MVFLLVERNPSILTNRRDRVGLLHYIWVSETPHRESNPISPQKPACRPPRSIRAAGSVAINSRTTLTGSAANKLKQFKYEFYANKKVLHRINTTIQSPPQESHLPSRFWICALLFFIYRLWRRDEIPLSSRTARLY